MKTKITIIGVLMFIALTTRSQNIIRTVAGDGTEGYSADFIQATLSELNQPSGVAVDINGNIFIADTYNNRIRRVDATTGIITTVAGNGSGTYSGDGGLAVSESLYHPESVAIDLSGNLYIADSWNNRIRKVDASTGLISTIAGTGTPGFSGEGYLATLAEVYRPSFVVLDDSGNIFYCRSI
jgi:sugar lactone lactonase YvrE